MSSNLAEKPIDLEEERAAAEANAIYKTAGAAFDLIETHRTPPAPKTYSIWYAYAAKSPEAVSEEVDEILQAHGAISAEQIEDIYQAHLSKSAFEQTGERVSQAIESSLNSVSQMISETSTETEAVRATLDDVGASMPKRPSRRDVMALFERLMETNDTMSTMTERLTSELEKSKEQVRQLNEEFEVIKRQSRTDALTDVANRRAFNERLTHVHNRAVETGEVYALALIDLDRFKTINDTYGHPIGDEVLSHLARLMVKNIEPTDFAARVGGDEFAIIFPGQSLETAYHSVVAMKHQLENLKVSDAISRDAKHKVTFSCGMSTFKKDRSIEDLMEAADQELLKAKRVSRNHISVEGRRI